MGPGVEEGFMAAWWPTMTGSCSRSNMWAASSTRACLSAVSKPAGAFLLCSSGLGGSPMICSRTQAVISACGSRYDALGAEELAAPDASACGITAVHDQSHNAARPAG